MRDRIEQRMSDNPSSAFICALQSIVYVKNGRYIVRQIDTSYTEGLWFGKYRKKQMSAHTCDRRGGFLFHFFPGWKKLPSVLFHSLGTLSNENGDGDGDRRLSGKIQIIICAWLVGKSLTFCVRPDVKRVTLTLADNVSILFRLLCYLNVKYSRETI